MAFNVGTPINYRLYIEGEQFDNASATLPEIEALMEELGSNGSAGTLEAWRGKYGPMEMSLTFSRIEQNPQMANLHFNPIAATNIMIRANQIIYGGGGAPVQGTFVFQASVRSKSHSGGDLEPDSNMEAEVTLAVDRVTYTINGSEIFFLDAASSESARVNGVPVLNNL